MIRILYPGIYNTVQDKGRFGFAKKGVPQSGSLDMYAAELANTLLNNDENCALLEVTFGQGKFEFTSQTFICISGGDFSPKLNSERVEMNRPIKVEAGFVLSFGKRIYGARTYISVLGGVKSKLVLGSRSFFQGITKTKLESGDFLNIETASLKLSNRFSKIKHQKEHFTSIILECYPGPEYHLLTEKQKQQLHNNFSVSEDANRVGVRLQELVQNNLKTILTSSVLPGTVQLTPSGQLIVLMRDCQVTGGYPRVLQLSELAISRVSQKIRGDILQFKLMEV